MQWKLFSNRSLLHILVYLTVFSATKSHLNSPPIQKHCMLYQHSSVTTGAIIRYLVKKGNNSRNIAKFVLYLQLVMMSKYSKFCVDTFYTFWVMGHDTFYTFWVMGHIKAFARWQQWWWQRRSSDHTSSTFSSKQTS